MLQQIRKLFKQIGSSADVETHSTVDMRMISAALLVEVATVDQELEQRERDTLTQLLRQHYALDADSANVIIDEAIAKRDQSTSLFEFTQAVNDQFSERDKYLLVLQMWQVAFSDNVIEAFEEYLIRRVSELIYLPHGLFTKARAEARDMRKD
ncbi:TerB family tellurite resistance protein [Microbulbifer sp. 2205BS26-8]|uniref:tellurite resistance TerB family protein n=1 Tax=Microbulbifer sp. 2205BS26-8 TaxID=3064386 RepID=UPI00273EAAE9|nr:TerB family tellurite resistance protein [Microbulbifer sp. 2205BS26-8]MDP5209234.1 TerB family tellurite resistance protein [Microbulbifer sp. 2205BS26-8]